MPTFIVVDFAWVCAGLLRAGVSRNAHVACFSHFQDVYVCMRTHTHFMYMRFLYRGGGEEEEEEGLFKADAVNEEDPERDHATRRRRREEEGGGGGFIDVYFALGCKPRDSTQHAVTRDA